MEVVWEFQELQELQISHNYFKRRERVAQIKRRKVHMFDRPKLSKITQGSTQVHELVPCVGMDKDFRRRNHESRCSPMAILSISDPEVWGSIPAGFAFIYFGFSYLLFAFRREIAHLI